MKKTLLCSTISLILSATQVHAADTIDAGSVNSTVSTAADAVGKMAVESGQKLSKALSIRAQSASRMFTYMDFGGVYHSYDSSVYGLDSSFGVDIDISVKPRQTEYFFGKVGYENSFQLTNLFDAGRSSWNFGAGAFYPINATYFPYVSAEYVLESTTGCIGSRCYTVDNDGLDATFGLKYLAGIDLAIDAAIITSSRDNGDQTGWRIGIDRFMHNMDQNEGAYITYTNLGDSKIEFGWRMRR